MGSLQLPWSAKSRTWVLWQRCLPSPLSCHLNVTCSSHSSFRLLPVSSQSPSYLCAPYIYIFESRVSIRENVYLSFGALYDFWFHLVSWEWANFILLYSCGDLCCVYTHHIFFIHFFSGDGYLNWPSTDAQNLCGVLTHSLSYIPRTGVGVLFCVCVLGGVLFCVCRGGVLFCVCVCVCWWWC